MTNARDQLATVVHQLEERVQQMHGHLMQMPVLQQELHNLQELHKRLQRDSEAQIQVGHSQASSNRLPKPACTLGV